MADTDYPKFGTYLSIIGGILILLSAVSALWVASFMYLAIPPGLLVVSDALNWWGVANGIIVIIFGGYLYARPMSAGSAYVVIIFSSISFVSLGGFIVGGILGIVGGAWALLWQEIRTTRAPRAKRAE